MFAEFGSLAASLPLPSLPNFNCQCNGCFSPRIWTLAQASSFKLLLLSAHLVASLIHRPGVCFFFLSFFLQQNLEDRVRLITLCSGHLPLASWMYFISNMLFLLPLHLHRFVKCSVLRYMRWGEKGRRVPCHWFWFLYWVSTFVFSGFIELGKNINQSN